MTALARRDVDATRRRFLDAAAELFARNGYHACTIRDIARAVGVTPGAVYAHYASKHELLLAVYEAGVERIGTALDARTHADESAWERLEAACRRHLEVVLADDGYSRVVIRVLPSDVKEVAGELTALRDRYEARFRTLIDALQLAPEVDRTLLRLELLGALNWTQVWFHKGHRNPSEIARSLVRNLRWGTEHGGPKP